jgi:ribonuclease J
MGNNVPAGRIFVDGLGVGDVGTLVLRDRKHLSQDGMIVVVVTLNAEDGSITAGPDIVSRGFIYVRENEELMDQLKKVALDTLENCRAQKITDWTTIKATLKESISDLLYKSTKRSPMILPIIMEV